jgi:NADH:ubiquinone oxidoreductase subunit 4 (subunit M)
MSLLTIIGILPLISAGLIALISTKNSELIKRAAFIATLIVAAASITVHSEKFLDICF